MESPSPKTIVIIGLSGAGVKVFNLLVKHFYPSSCRKNGGSENNVRVIAIDKSRYAFWPPGSLRAAVLPGFEDQVVASFDHLVPARVKADHPDMVKVITGTEVVQLDLTNRSVVLDHSPEGLGIEGGNKIPFDGLVICTGSQYAFPCRPDDSAESPEQLKAKFRELQEGIKSSESILVVGAGAVGIELAGEVSYQYKDKKVILVCSTPSLMPDYSHRLSKSLENQLIDRGVDIIFGYRVNLDKLGRTQTGRLEGMAEVELTSVDGKATQQVQADFLFMAIGNKPNTKLVPQEYLEPKTLQIQVNSNLQVVNGSTSEVLQGVYALGDAIYSNDSKLYAALDGQASTVSKNLSIDIQSSGRSVNKVVHKPFLGTIAVPLGPQGGASQLFGFSYGLGAFATSLAKGKSLLVWMFKSLYPDKDP